MHIEVEGFRLSKAFQIGDEPSRDSFIHFLRSQSASPNSFWIKTSSNEYPTLNVTVNGIFATVNYCDRKDGAHSNWISISNLKNIDEDGMTSFFYASETEEQEMPNYLVIDVDTALQVALEFFHSPNKRPECIEWDEL